MERSLILSVLLLQFLAVIHAGDIQIHTLMGGPVELVGEVPSVQVKSVLWKWNKDKAAEWDEGDQEPSYYSIFQNKAKLNMLTWALTISDLQPEFNGRYAISFNDASVSKSYQLVVLEPVSKPNITQDCSPSSCTLTCQGIDSIYTKYTWTDDQGRTETGSVWRVEKSEGLDVVYSCNFSNPVSWKTSSIREGELFAPEARQINLGIILGPIVAAVVIVGVGVGVGVGVMICKKRGQLQHIEMQQMNERSQNQLDGQEARPSDEAGGAGGNMRPLLINNEDAAK